MNKVSLIVDLDGTLCDDSHRTEFAEAKDWDAYHSRCVEDQPRRDVQLFVQMIGVFQNIDIIALTGRTDDWRPATIEWLSRNRVEVNHLFMRPATDYRSADEVKWELLLAHFGDEEELKANVLLMLENEQRHADFWRGKGIPVWLVS